MTRILVTGATGYLGKHLCDSVLQSLPDANLLGLARHAPQTSYPYPVLPLDLVSQSLKLEILLADFSPTIIYHLAAAHRCESLEAQLQQTVGGTRQLLQTLLNLGMTSTRVVIVGSAAEYGLNGETLCEQSVCKPVGAYGQAKLKQTLLAQQFSGDYHFNIVTARVFNLYGHWLPDGMPADLVMGRLIPQIAQAKAGDTLNVHNLKAVRDFIHMRDVTNALLHLGSSGDSGAIYNVASGYPLSIQQALSDLLDARQLEGQVKINAIGPQVAEYSWADPSAMKALGWAVEIDWKTGLNLELRQCQNRQVVLH